MSAERISGAGDAPLTDSRMLEAISQLQEMIRTRYPSAVFQLARGQDDPQAVHLYATIDLEDTEELVDLVIERLLTLQVDEGLPIHVIPLRTAERRAAVLKQL